MARKLEPAGKKGLTGEARTPTRGKSAGRHLTCDAWRRNCILFETPRHLLAWWDRDREGLLGRVEQLLLSEHVGKRRPLSPANLKPRIQLGPFNPDIDPLSGDLGFACLVMPPTESYTKNTGDYSLKPVRTPFPPS